MTKDELYFYKLELLKRKAIKGDILAFTKLTYRDYQINWHHRVLAKYLNDFAQKKILRLIITMPPRHGKSELTSRRLPPLIHGMYPNDEILTVSYNGQLASDMTKDVQRIMDMPEYKEIFPTVRIPNDGGTGGYKRTANEHEIMPYQHEDRLWTWHTGSLKSAGVGGSFTGRGGDWVLIDDPVKNREDADSLTFRESLWKFYSSTIRTRLEKNASILLTMTRWHDDDLAGRILNLAKSDKDADQWTVLSLPAIKENDLFPEDTRAIGEVLWPDKYDLKSMMSTKASIGSRDWQALYQQKPAADGGNIIQEKWFKFYDKLPDKFDSIIQSWDFAVKDKATSDFTVGQVWGKIGPDKYFLDQVRGRFDFPTACNKVLMLSEKWPTGIKKLIEAKANGPAIMQTLRKQISGMVEVEPRGDKISRVHAISPEFESGHVYFPSKAIAPWIGDYINELISFPTAVHDDQVDASTQAIDELISQERTSKLRIRYL